MTSRWRILIILAVLSLLAKCTSPTKSGDLQFSLTIDVVDFKDAPISGLRVSAWNNIEPNSSNNSSRSSLRLSSSSEIGDINCNGLAFEVGDYVMFGNYFLFGESAFFDHLDCSNAASDINGDGVPTTPQDFALLIQKFIQVSPGPLNIAFDTIHADYNPDYRRSSDFIIMDGVEVAVLVITLGGNQDVYLQSDRLTLSYRYDSESNHTKVVVTVDISNRNDSSSVFTGLILSSGGEIISAVGATIDGRPVVLSQQVYRPLLYDAFPSHADSIVRISAGFRTPESYRILFYDLLRDTVDIIVDSVSEPGFYNHIWSPPTKRPGVYLYSIEAEVAGTTYVSPHRFAVFWNDSPGRNVVGFADVGGRFKTDDASRFPWLFELSDLKKIDSNNNLLGTITYSNHTTIVLTDTATGMIQHYEMVMSGGVNKVKLTWLGPRP